MIKAPVLLARLAQAEMDYRLHVLLTAIQIVKSVKIQLHTVIQTTRVVAKHVHIAMLDRE
jgi:hypothetical protein